MPFILADRFQGTTPLEYKHMLADDRAWIVQILGIEGMVNRIWEEAHADVEPDTEVFIVEFEYDLWDDD